MATQIPEQGTDWQTLQADMLAARGKDVAWKDGRAAVYVFHSGDDVMGVAHDAYGMFIAENGLGPAAFPSLKRMESEVISIALDLQQAPEGAAGCMTSGGTESIVMAMKACRDWSAANRPVQGTPKVVVPYSAHPAFNKGAHMLGMEVVRVPTAEGYLADVDAMAGAVDARTVMVVGSAPCFPYGVIDPIERLGQLAESANLWLHVDACVGGYLTPFMREVHAEAGREVLPACDFCVPVVASISLDLHKYGYAAKGASTVLYRQKVYRDAQVFHFEDWPCGHMYTPTLAGTRPGGAIAAAWAVLHYLGRSGYVARAQRIDAVRRRLEDFCAAEGLTVFGAPGLSIIAFGDERGDILAAGEGLYAEGWFSSRVQNPDGIQYMISPEHDRSIDAYLDVLGRCVKDARAGRLRRGGAISYS